MRSANSDLLDRVPSPISCFSQSSSLPDRGAQLDNSSNQSRPASPERQTDQYDRQFGT